MGATRAEQGRREARVQAAARRLFRENGYSATSIRQIAQAAGVWVGTVANCGDKASLLSGIFEANEVAAMLGRLAVAEAQGSTGVAADADLVFGSWFAHLDSSREMVRDYLAMLVDGSRGERFELDVALGEALARRIVAHHLGIEPERGRAVAHALFCTYACGVMAALMELMEPEVAQQQARATVEQLVRGL